ncbi:unnamed protein product [Ectocarpus sp. 12 AP-2014]
MMLISLRWSSASSLVNRVPTRGAGRGAHLAASQRSLSSNVPTRRQEKPRDLSTSRWRLARSMSVSGSKLAFSPKPPPQPSPQGGLAKQGVSAQDALAGSNRIDPALDIGKGSTATAAPMAKTKPLPRKTFPVPVLEASIVPKKRISGGPFRQDGVTSAAVDAETLSVAATAREPAAGGGGADRIGFRQLLSTKTPEQQLSRSGSAPDPSTTTLRIASKMTTGLPTYQLAEVRPHLLPGRGKVECAPAELKVDLTVTTRSCWDESRDSIVPVEAVSRSQDGTTPTRGNTAAKPTAAKGK